MASTLAQSPTATPETTPDFTASLARLLTDLGYKPDLPYRFSLRDPSAATRLSEAMAAHAAAGVTAMAEASR